MGEFKRQSAGMGITGETWRRPATEIGDQHGIARAQNAVPPAAWSAADGW
ncbi:MAG: hypothetical protein MO846_12380 [Candidatus Devosia symbiotica]|nr:hypothetical protein [Candidatus Devosia symbiotica]